ncbi:pentatricopeptide repeat-containing protein At2g13600-like [Wolffia australiana]
METSTALANLLKSFAQAGSLNGVRKAHALLLLRTGFSSETFILNRLVDCYAKCGAAEEARKVFDRIPEKNVFSWNAVVSACARAGRLAEARELFAAMPARDPCSWNSMVSGLSQHGCFAQALGFFAAMRAHGFSSGTHSFSSALSACAGLEDRSAGAQIHAAVAKTPLARDVFLGSALVDMYAKCGLPADARRVFDEMPERNTVSWNSLITCYEHNGPAEEALLVFSLMLAASVPPDEVTLASLASACATLQAIRHGSEIHSRVVKHNRLRSDLVLGNALVDMYAKCGRLDLARRVFDAMPVWNVVSETSMLSGYARSASITAARSVFLGMTDKNIVAWNALIAGYAQSGCSEEALDLFRQLKRDAFWPTEYTLGNVLSACATLASLPLGLQAHAQALKHGALSPGSGSEPAVFVANSLVDLYFKCGAPDEAMKVFFFMPARDRVSWNAAIVGLAQNGGADRALQLFDQMARAGESPDQVTMVGVLTACSHAGRVEDGQHHFRAMTELHGLVPSRDHYTCMIDLLGRAGRLREAAELVAAMPMVADAVIWGSLLAACRVHGDVELGEQVASRLMEINMVNSAPYVQLANMYAEAGRWGDAKRVRTMMRRRRVEKQPGCSWIAVEDETHVFMVKDKVHPRRKEIHSVVRSLELHMKKSVDFC